ncbi:MAG: amino-acid N-acetyltransferase [Halothiobacillaceae bacterium]
MSADTHPTLQQLLRDAAPYIHAHRGRTVVLAFAGEALLEQGLEALASDVALLSSLGVRLVLVPGSRPQIEAELHGAGLRSRFHAGLRITGEAELSHVKRAVAVQTVDLIARLSQGMPNTPLEGARLSVVTANLVIARPAGVRDGVDLGWTGEVRKVESERLIRLLDAGHVILQPCLGTSPTGEVFNLRAEDVAVELAVAIRADKLVFLTESASSLPAQMTIAEAAAWQDSAALSAEFRLHLASAVQAVRRGVGRVHLVDRRNEGALLRELFTREGNGTLVTAEPVEKLRRATIDDVGGILELIRPLEDEGVLVRRPREQLELEIERHWVVDLDGRIIATAALHTFPDAPLAELACLTVHPDYRRGGRASQLLRQMEREAVKQGLEGLFVLTTHTAHWFIEHGFRKAEVSDLPVSRQAIYNAQRNSKVFIKTLQVASVPARVDAAPSSSA